MYHASNITSLVLNPQSSPHSSPNPTQRSKFLSLQGKTGLLPKFPETQSWYRIGEGLGLCVSWNSVGSWVDVFFLWRDFRPGAFYLHFEVQLSLCLTVRVSSGLADSANISLLWLGRVWDL